MFNSRSELCWNFLNQSVTKRTKFCYVSESNYYTVMTAALKTATPNNVTVKSCMYESESAQRPNFQFCPRLSLFCLYESYCNNLQTCSRSDSFYCTFYQELVRRTRFLQGASQFSEFNGSTNWELTVKHLFVERDPLLSLTSRGSLFPRTPTSEYRKKRSSPEPFHVIASPLKGTISSKLWQLNPP